MNDTHSGFLTLDVQIVGIFEPYFFKKIVWTLIFRVGRSYVDVHAYESIHNLRNGDSLQRDFFKFEVLPMEILHSMVSLMIFDLIINQ